MRKFYNWITGNWWVVARCGWPYPDGYCLLNRATRTTLDHGLSREMLQDIADHMNTPAPLNLWKLAPFLFVVLVLTGCIFTRPVYTESRRPIIPLPAFKPLDEIPNVLPEDRAKATEAYTTATVNVVRLIEYAEALEAVIKQYNDESEKLNKKNGYTAPEPEKSP